MPAGTSRGVWVDTQDILEINCDGDYESAPLLSNLKYVAFREKYFPNGEVCAAEHML